MSGGKPEGGTLDGAPLGTGSVIVDDKNDTKDTTGSGTRPVHKYSNRKREVLSYFSVESAVIERAGSQAPVGVKGSSADTPPNR